MVTWKKSALAVYLVAGGLLLPHLSQSQTKTDLPQIDPQNLPLAWKCEGKYSGRTLTVRLHYSDLRPSVYVESAGFQQMLSEENFIFLDQKKSWGDDTGHTLACFGNVEKGRRSLRFLQISGPLVGAGGKNVSAELQNMPTFDGDANCAAVKSAGPFDASEYMTCTQAPVRPTLIDDARDYRGALQPDPSFGASGAKVSPRKFEADNRHPYAEAKLGLDRKLYISIRENNSEHTSTDIGFSEIRQVDPASGDERVFVDSDKFSESVLKIFGIKSDPAGNYVEIRSFALDTKSRVVIGGLYYSAGKEDIRRPILVRLKTDGTIDPTFGSNGTLWLTPGNQNSNNINAVSYHPLKNGRAYAFFQSLKGAQKETSGNLILLSENGAIDAKFSQALPASKEITDALKTVGVVVEADSDAEGNFLLAFHESRYGSSSSSKFLAVNIQGQAIENFFTEQRNHPELKDCSLLSAKPRKAGGWLLAWSCYNKTYDTKLVKVDAKGEIDREFGKNGVAGLRAFASEANLDSRLDRYAFSRIVPLELSNGNILVPFPWKGAFSQSPQVGLLQLTQNGSIDASFGDRGILAGGLAHLYVGAKFRGPTLTEVSGIGVFSVMTGGHAPNYIGNLILRRYK